MLSIDLITFLSLSTIVFTSFGCIIIPSLATVAATNAICIGVDKILLCPIPLCAIFPTSELSNVGNLLAVIETPGPVITELNPKSSAVDFNLLFPNSIANVPNTTLLDTLYDCFKLNDP